MQPRSWREAATHEPRAQGDGSPEPLYTVDLPEYGVQVRVTVQRMPDAVATDDPNQVERGYGHGV
jgi:hypothetical protein